MLITKKDFVKYGCKLIDNKYYVNVGGKWYKLKKSKYAMNYSPIHVNDRMTGKMHDMCACSTSCACNKFCIARRKLEGYICNKCYAESTVEKGRYGKQLSELLETNFELLNSTVLPLELLPRFPNLSISRIEAFGDVASVICAINYANIAKGESECHIWMVVEELELLEASIRCYWWKAEQHRRGSVQSDYQSSRNKASDC